MMNKRSQGMHLVAVRFARAEVAAVVTFVKSSTLSTYSRPWPMFDLFFAMSVQLVG